MHQDEGAEFRHATRADAVDQPVLEMLTEVGGSYVSATSEALTYIHVKDVFPPVVE